MCDTFTRKNPLVSLEYHQVNNVFWSSCFNEQLTNLLGMKTFFDAKLLSVILMVNGPMRLFFSVQNVARTAHHFFFRCTVFSFTAIVAVLPKCTHCMQKEHDDCAFPSVHLPLAINIWFTQTTSQVRFFYIKTASSRQLDLLLSYLTQRDHCYSSHVKSTQATCSQILIYA